MPPSNYRQLADQAADRYGIPRKLFRALIRQESGWRTDARSGEDAVGLVQIHLPSHPDVTRAQAQDPAFALDWGARYLAAQYKRFGKWNLALAAYNAGPGRVEDGSWDEITETANYVNSVLGMAGDTNTPTAPAVSFDAAAPMSMPTVDMSGPMLEGLTDIASGQFDPVAQLGRAVQARRMQVDQSVAAAQTPVAVAPVSSPAPQPTRGYTSMSLGKVIGTPGHGTHTVGNWQSDNAWDISLKVGTPIRADEDGVIGDRIGYLGNPKDKGRFAGMRVYVNGKSNTYYYAHLSRLTVKPGQRVKRGQIIGYSGTANGVPHLHFAKERI